MKKLLYTISMMVLAAGLFSSCEEWQPLADPSIPEYETAATLTPNITIQDLKALYKSGPVHIEKDYVIGGQVISSDAAGNVYRSLYLQDETGGIEVKLGLTGLYNDY